MVAGKGLCKRIESPIDIDIIDHESTARSQNFPGTIQLKPHVALGVQAIVNK